MPTLRISAVASFKPAWIAALSCVLLLSGCGGHGVDGFLVQRTRVDLMDWHISGLWVINCPVAWVRVTNYNLVPIKEVTLEYQTFTSQGKLLDTGEFIIEGTVPAGTSKNFIELYLGLVDLHSERLSIRLKSVRQASVH